GSGGRNSIGVRGTFLKERFTEGCQLLSQCVTEPAFAPEEIERTRTLVLEELRARADNPAGLAFDLFNKCLWDQHPYRLDVLGNRESLMGATPDRLRKFCDGMLTADGAVISVVGAIEVERTLDLLEEMAAGLGRSEALRAPPGDELPLAAPRTARLVRDRAQAHIVLGYRGLSLNDPDRHALELLCSVLSGQGGRLFLELRDRQSLCYTVNAFSVEGIEPGSFTVYMGTSPEKVPQAIEGIDRMLAALCDEGITAAELARAQRYLVGTHDIGLQRLGARAATTALNELYGLGWDAHLGYAGRVEAVTLDDIRRVAQRLIDPRGRVLALVGPDNTPGPEADWRLEPEVMQ
ncbi:MAG: M16 family metallopeptidase, partial [Myxococcota bacterium]